jgi:hypothetical protein
MNERKRPLSVTILGWVYIIVGVGGFVSHLGDLRANSPFQFDGIWVEMVRLLALVCGVFMLRGQNWARWLAVVWIGFHVILSAFHQVLPLILHCIFFAVISWLLFRRDAARYFRGQ